jgi:glycosyltransferase involved in cell wall biosynthesis
VSAKNRIAIAVHGRFHAFDLARGLRELGQDVALYTNYPTSSAARFGLPAESMHSNVTHGLAARAAARLFESKADPVLLPWFGRWAARHMAEQEWDVTHTWSGVSEEWLNHNPSARYRTIARGSAHIRAQLELLETEQERTSSALDKPIAWTVAREEREYARATKVIVPSRFAERTFIEHGLAPDRLACVPFATSADGFAAPADIISERIKRVRSGGPLRIAYVGTVSYRKGMHDLATVIETLPRARFEFRLIGPIASECNSLARRLEGRVALRGKKTQQELRDEYAWADVLVLPSIEDGFAVVLCQATAAGLPFIASTHSGGPDLVEAGSPGWLLPPRAPEAWAEQLALIDADRAGLADQVAATRAAAPRRTWTDVAHDFLKALMPNARVE